MSCHKCSCNLPRENENWIDRCGNQNYTCCECLKYYCDDCEDDQGNSKLTYCGRCERCLCLDCQSMKYCTGCLEYHCVDCVDFIECSVCNRCYICKDCRSDWWVCCKCERSFCDDNGNSCWNSQQSGTLCNDCRKFCCDDCVQEYGWPRGCECCTEFCYDCNEKKIGIDAIRICKSCDEYSCGRCLVSMMDKNEESNDFCVGCVQLAGRLLVEKNKKVQKEYEEAKAEIKELKHQLQCKDRRFEELEEKMKQTDMS